MDGFTIFWWSIRLLFLICSPQVQCSHRRARVNTTLGVYIGKVITVTDKEANRIWEINEFLSIPFAKPPIDDLRLRKPVPIDAMPTGFHKCSEIPKACFQKTKHHYPWVFNYKDGWLNEDCLYLNIWAPKDACSLNKKSILFWIHGGGFSSGSIRMDVYNGKVLAALGDVIVVTTNYRTGGPGFWTNDTPDAPGNYGIWDVIEALRWVNTHIEAFGGDKHSITIAGQDAGAVIVSLLAVTPQVWGLFQRQIVQSGSAMWTIMSNPQDVFDSSEDLSRHVECTSKSFRIADGPEKIAKCMREDVFDSDLLQIEKEGYQSESPNKNNEIYFPTFPKWGRDELFPDNPKDMLLDDSLAFKDLLIGTSGNEGAFLLPLYDSSFSFFDEIYMKSFNRTVAETLLRKALKDYSFQDTAYQVFEEDKIVDEYLPRKYRKLPVEIANWKLSVAEAIGDVLFACPTINYATLCSQRSRNVYFYDFQSRPSKSEWADWTKTNHFDEVYYVFGSPILLFNTEEDNLNDIQYPLSFTLEKFNTPEDRRLSRKIIEHWSNFVKYGKPDKNWPKYGKGSERLVYINDRMQLLSYGPHKHKCRLWWRYTYPSKAHIIPDYPYLNEDDN